VGRHGDGRPGDDDNDAGEGSVPVALKYPAEVRPDSLQSPHDPDATYSGHKRTGYEVQVAEACDTANATQIITYVEVTPSSGSDAAVPVARLDGLAKRQVQPEELYTDTTYGSGRNAFELECRGTELVSPVAGAAPGKGQAPEPGGGGDPRLTGRGLSQLRHGRAAHGGSGGTQAPSKRRRTTRSRRLSWVERSRLDPLLFAPDSHGWP
jgi:hypothetical protein